MTDLRISHSEMQCFMRCPRKWFITYYLGYSPDPARVLPFGNAQLGSRLHLALEGAYGHGLDGVRVLEYLYSAAIRERPECEHDLMKEEEQAVIMYRGFLDWAADTGFDMGYQVIAAEQEVEVVIEKALFGYTRLVLMTKLDQIVRRTEDGALLFRDWKTVGSMSKADGLLRNTQMRTYALIQALRARQHPACPRVDGGQYVMLLRSKRTARAKGPFYDKIDLPSYNRHDLNSAYLRTREIGSRILETRQRLDKSRSHQLVTPAVPLDGDCEWSCPFKDECTLLDDGSRWEDALAANFVKQDPYAYYSTGKMQEILQSLGGKK